MSARPTHRQPLYITVAHGGAGYHPPTSDSSLKRSLRAVISSVLPVFSSATTPSPSGTTSSGGSSSESPSLSSSALDATTAIIAALENHPDFNAGYGSNLTFDGQVECDASLMLSTTEEGSSPSSSSPPPLSYSFGSVGAVRGVRNPILLARSVLEERMRGRERERGSGPGMGMGMGMGRVPPLMLVGEGAVQF